MLDRRRGPREIFPGVGHAIWDLLSRTDLALILVDARKGILTRTGRHSHIVSLVGIRRTILAVNKMDLFCYARPTADPQASLAPTG